MMTTTPKQEGYFFPAEWAPHRATWLSWPHKEASWPGKLEAVYGPYCRFIKEISIGEEVCINVVGPAMEAAASQRLAEAGVDLEKVRFFHHPTDDAWCRDHGPAFLVNRREGVGNAVVDWGYNAWGNKYPPYDQDDVIPTRVAEALGLPVFHPGIVMEGGAVDFNGQGAVLTTTSCLLNKNRNPQLTQAEIEHYLMEYYGVSQVLWLGEGIVGDDTDGHIDDITRFVDTDTVVTVIEKNRGDENYGILRKNLQLLEKMRLADGRRLNIIELPMPAPVIYDGQRLPASYANFYIANAVVAVPLFRDDENDQRALDTLAACFPTRKIVGIDSTDVIWGLGSWHCLSQQEPR